VRRGFSSHIPHPCYWNMTPLSIAQPVQSREIRVFLSSTFKDMEKERDHLLTQVFPVLRQICSERNVAFTEIDLRWGVREEDAKNGRTVEICLEEIDRCRVFPPFFIGFLGERYGWVPQRGQLEQFWTMRSASPYKDRIEAALEEGISVIELEMQYGFLENAFVPSHARVFSAHRR
jgi:nephrocystin-3